MIFKSNRLAMPEKNLIIIGGGLAGLSTGCYAQMNGFKTQIFEHNSIPGGVCTTWKRGDYKIDGCIHWLFGHRYGNPFYNFYKEVGAIDGINLIDCSTYANYIDEKRDRHFVITSDYEEMSDKFFKTFPEDREIMADFLKGCRDITKIDIYAEKPIELQGFFERINSFWKMKGFLKYLIKYGKSSDEFVKTIKDPYLKKIIINLFVEGTTTLFGMMMLGYLFNKQLGMVEGGSLNLALAIEKNYKKLGGKITYNSTVEKIIVKDNSAVGVRLVDGSVHYADIIISASDLHSTLYEMLGGKFITKQFDYMFKNWKMFTPLMLVSFGVNNLNNNIFPVNVIFLEKPIKYEGGEIERFVLRDYSYDLTLAPKGKTIIQAEIETSFDFWINLRSNTEAYKMEKEKVSQAVLNHLEKFYPGIKNKVEVVDVATPYTFWRYARIYRGAFEGWIMNMETIKKPIRKFIPELKNFYLTGQWVEPGGGVPSAVWSGRKVIQLICKNEKKEFKVNGN